MNSNTALFWNLRYCNDRIVIRFAIQNGSTALSLAASRFCASDVRLLLGLGANVNAVVRVREGGRELYMGLVSEYNSLLHMMVGIDAHFKLHPFRMAGLC